MKTHQRVLIGLAIGLLATPLAAALPPQRSVIGFPCQLIQGGLESAVGCDTVANLAGEMYFQFIADRPTGAGSVNGNVYHDGSCQASVIVANSGVHITFTGADGDKWWVQAGIIAQNLCRDTKPYVEYYHYSNQQYVTMVAENKIGINTAFATISAGPGAGDCPISASSAGWSPPSGLALGTPCTGTDPGYMLEIIADPDKSTGSADVDGGVTSWNIGGSTAACGSSWLHYGEQASPLTGTISCSSGTATARMF